MATALESASLVMAPCGYEDGTLGSLQPTDGSGDFTFTRGSNLSATRVNAAGNIEKGYENLLLQSNSFSNATWAKSSVSVTSGQSGYDGTNDAWLLSKSASNAYINQSNITNGVQAFSIYAKANESNFLYVRIYSDSPRVYFDLINGVATNSGPVISSSMEDVGDGWYRCSFSTNLTAANFLRIYPAEAAFDSSATTGSIYIQDAQINQGLVAYPYIETTTTTAQGGILEDTPRIDYSSGPNGSLLLEPSRTNLIPYSEYFVGSGWQRREIVVYPNQSTAPDGTLTATNLAINGGNSELSFLKSSGLVIGADMVFSFYVKKVSNSLPKYAIYDNTNLNYIIPRTLYNITEEWVRVEIPFTIPTGCTSIKCGIVYQSGSGAEGTNINIWGAQLEEASYPTSYIPTYGTSVTRAGDVCGDAGNSSTFNDSEGVLYAEIAALADDSTHRFILLGDGTSQNEVRMAFENFGTSIISLRVTVSGTPQAFEWKQFSLPSILNYKKIAIVYAENRFELWVNGVKERSSSSGSTFPSSTLDRLDFKLASGQLFYGNVKQVVYFPTALSDAALIELTTL